MDIDRTVHDIVLTEIYSDDEFNCRGKIAPMDVIDLAHDIRKNGLDVPIVVQPYDKHPPQKYRIIAGHRRYMAFRVNQSGTIPCNIRADLDDFAAAGLNLRENLTRKQLNIKQEAHGIKRYMLAGWNENAVATYIQQSRGWVQIRFQLLKLPEDIQNEAAAGMLTQAQISKMHCMRTDEQYALLRAIKEARYKNEDIELPTEKKRDLFKETKKTQDRYTIFAMIDHLLQVTKSGLHTRCLAWSAGEISDYELYQDIATHCKDNNIPYTIPKNVTDQIVTNKVA